MSSLENQFKHFSWYNKLPNNKEEVCQENLDLFFQIMFERQEVWYKRNILKLPQPWTENPFLRDYKFTNVYRELDRSSQYLIQKVLLNKELSREDLVWQIILFRAFNMPDTFETVGLPLYKDYDKDDFLAKIDDYANAGNNPFTTAYMINATYCKGTKRHLCYCNIFVPQLHAMVPKIINAIKVAEVSKRPERVIEELLRLPMVAHFLAHEFYQDFTYTARYSHIQLMKFTQDDYTNVGPGASAGIRMIFPNLKSIKEQERAIYRLRNMATLYLAKIGDFKYLNWDRDRLNYLCTPGMGNVSLHQIEMWLCEFQKYKKMEWNDGKQRQKFIQKTK